VAEEYVVDEQGIRLEEFLAQIFPNLSLGTLRRAMVGRCASVNGVPRQRKWRLRPEDIVTFEPRDILEVRIEPVEYPLDVLFEDEHAVVVNKPSGIGTVPDTRAADSALINGVCHIMGTRPYIVHRLDRGTSGAIIFAKCRKAAKWIGFQFENRLIEKEYLAIVDGVPSSQGTIDAPIGRVPEGDPVFQAIEDGLASITEYNVEEEFGQFSLVKARPHTGRTHQIRIHMHYIGHPLAVDALYGKRNALYTKDVDTSGDDTEIITRLTLHASRIVFTSPSHEKTIVNAPMPSDMKQALETLRRTA
jgi:23S rRNA pseudouridine1911/1915/1917 synthase